MTEFSKLVRIDPPRSTRGAVALGIALTLLSSSLICVGCGGKQSGSDGEAATDQHGRSAREYLQLVFGRYRNAQSYHDHGVVRLSYQKKGRLDSEQAPLSVWMNAGSVHIKAYDVRVWSDTEGIMAWITDPTTANHDSQVLRFPPTSGRIELKTLLADAVLNDRLSSGLAGPPPQLDWLLAEKPMERLFQEQHEMVFAPAREWHGRLCTIVSVNAAGDRYQFWIDAETSVIHRVDLPSVEIPDEEATDLRLTLELNGASFDRNVQRPTIDDLPSEPRFVGKFVPVPPSEPDQGLGRRPSRIQLRDRGGKTLIDGEKPGRQVAVILFTSDSPRSMQNIVAFQQWAASLDADVASRVRCVVATDRKTAQALPPEMSIPIAVDKDQQARDAIVDANRGREIELVVIDSKGVIAWLEETIQPHEFVSLARIVGDVVSGVDVPRRLLDQWRANVKTYRGLLDTELARHRESKTSQ